MTLRLGTWKYCLLSTNRIVLTLPWRETEGPDKDLLCGIESKTKAIECSSLQLLFVFYAWICLFFLPFDPICGDLVLVFSFWLMVTFSHPASVIRVSSYSLSLKRLVRLHTS